MHWAETGKSISLRIKVPPVDFRAEFEESKISPMLAAAEKLTRLAEKLSDMDFII